MRFTKVTNYLHIAFLCVILCAAVFLPEIALAGTCAEGDSAACLNNSESAKEVFGIILLILNFLAAAVGIVAVISLIIAGIQYSAAADNPQAVQAAKQRITNVIIGLAAFFLLYGFLQWLIPGGFGI